MIISVQLCNWYENFLYSCMFLSTYVCVSRQKKSKRFFTFIKYIFNRKIITDNRDMGYISNCVKCTKISTLPCAPTNAFSVEIAATTQVFLLFCNRFYVQTIFLMLHKLNWILDHVEDNCVTCNFLPIMYTCFPLHSLNFRSTNKWL